MSIPAPPEPTLRWCCTKCGQDIPEDRCVALHPGDLLGAMMNGAYAFAELRGEEAFTPLSGPAERGHEISWTIGGRAGVLGGWTRHHDVCGPVRLRTVSTQELFLEWLDDRSEKKWLTP